MKETQPNYKVRLHLQSATYEIDCDYDYASQ